MPKIKTMKRLYLLIIFLLSCFFLYSNSSRKEIVSALFKSVENWMGTDYKYGGATDAGIDCSAFVIKVYKEVFNKALPRTVKDQKNLGIKVAEKLEPGDLIFFNINGQISHVGIYVFDNKFIHAASSGPVVGVIKSSLDEKYYKDRFAFAKRIINLPPYIKEEKDKKQEKDFARIEAGKVLFKGELLDCSTEFNEHKPIFLEIINKNLDNDNYSIVIKQGLEDNPKTIDNFRNENILISTRDSQKEFIKIFLPKGIYSLELNINKNNIIFQKNILVN